MSFDLVLWRPRAGSRRSRAFICAVLAEGVPCDGVEPLDCEMLGRDLDETLPTWCAGDQGLTVDLSTESLHVSIGGEAQRDDTFAILRVLAARHGLEVFNPQEERISAKDERAVAKYVESHAGSALAEQFGVWQRAAAKGDASAMNELGNAYSWGEGVREDATLAAQWYARAAALDHVGATANLAECYRCGEGVARDPDLAARWFEHAGACGNLEALVRLAELYRSGDDMPRDPARARAILERTLPKDGQVSAFMLAEMNESGEGGARDIDRAKRLYHLSFENGHPEARARLRRLGEEP